MESTRQTLQFRSDLTSQRVQMGTRFFWVLKDPLSRAYFYVTDREYKILQLLNGRRSFAEIVRRCARQFAPDFVSSTSILNFLTDATSKGLVYPNGKTVADLSARQSWLAVRKSATAWSNPLAIRFPGWNPDKALDSVAKRVRGIMSPTMLLAIGLLWLCAIAIVTVHFEELCRDVSVATSRSGTSWWLLLAGVIAGTKVLHEVGHAVTCKALGAECREVGVMLLVGVPCLYCDVSDAWMLPEKWKRILISLAGILMEIVIAALAVLLWTQVQEGIVRDLCVTLILVCSVSTILFNGNPLLRYDGYFVLSDIVGIPNLSARSNSLIIEKVRRVIWRIPAPAVPQEEAKQNHRLNRFLIGYAVASGAYRCLVLSLIAAMFYTFLADSGMQFVAMILVCLFFVVCASRAVRPVLTPPDRSLRRSMLGRSRRSLFIAIAITACLIALILPLPRSVTAPMTLQPVDAHPIYAGVSGELVQPLAISSLVERGTTLANLSSADHEFEWEKLDSTKAVLQKQLDVLRQTQGIDGTAASKIRLLEKQLAQVQNKQDLIAEDLSELVIRSPSTGAFYSPPNRLKRESAHQTWSNVPFDIANPGAKIKQGELLGTVGHPTKREAILFVKDKFVTDVQVGQPARLCLATSALGSIAGKVIDISPLPVGEIPRELIAAGLVVEPTESLTTKSVYYQVRVALSQPIDLPVRSTGNALIRVESMPVLSRLRRRFADVFR